MYIILVGNPWKGFTIRGPINKPDDGSIGEWACAEYCGTCTRSSCRKGTAAASDSNIGQWTAPRE
jgi:hypothetical protein